MLQTSNFEASGHAALPLARSPDEYFRLVVDAAPTGIVLVDDAGKIVLANRHALALFRYDETELIGQPIEALLPERIRTTHPERVRSFFTTPSERSMGKGRDLYAVRKDGAEFPVEIGLTPIPTSTGIHVLATIVDITDRKAAEDQIARNRDLFNTVVEAAPTGIVMIDLNGRITLVNCQIETLFGYSRHDLIGQPIEVLLPARLRHGHPGHVRNFFNDPSSRAMGASRDLFASRRDGSEFPVEIGLSPVQLHDGRQVLASVVDISERKRAETRLRRANEGLEEFVYVASHDLRSPLRGIADLIEWIGEDLAETPNAKISENLDRVSVRISRLEQLIADLLAYARAGNSEAEVHEFTVTNLIDRVLELQPPRAGFQITREVPELEMVAARTPLETVLRNLMSNAFKHHDRENGTVSISVHETGNIVEFTITDDGPGIPARAQDRIFKLFQTASSERQSSGVGLAVSKRMVEAHGGWIMLESIDGQRGTTFRLHWPKDGQTVPMGGIAR